MVEVEKVRENGGLRMKKAKSVQSKRRGGNNQKLS
jgi:hypothetical protein